MHLIDKISSIIAGQPAASTLRALCYTLAQIYHTNGSPNGLTVEEFIAGVSRDIRTAINMGPAPLKESSYSIIEPDTGLIVVDNYTL